MGLVRAPYKASFQDFFFLKVSFCLIDTFKKKKNLHPLHLDFFKGFYINFKFECQLSFLGTQMTKFRLDKQSGSLSQMASKVMEGKTSKCSHVSRHKNIFTKKRYMRQFKEEGSKQFHLRGFSAFLHFQKFSCTLTFVYLFAKFLLHF